MRAGDADRQAVAERLRAALNEGRLELHEYDDRLQRAYAAKTYAELDGLLSDLPAVAPAERSQVVPAGAAEPSLEWAPGPDGRYPGAARRWLWTQWNSYFKVITILTVIWLVSGLSGYGLRFYWPVWVAGPWGAVLLWQTVNGLGGGEPQRWAARQARRKQERRERREQRQADTEGTAPAD
ncbi:DUF1707 SHOCT-like domain-containing protein [Rhizomonospora bruguierae]|uniref:DUF1707 SHOCT-like domain-containing protein n=1 Tax=Rhizomonospora bruguierae TaxID=1581705 RepID=UPI001BCD0532|nr:DUF1707 domain-containing protein [Micromonospora sp. NBRC 107566]